MLRKTKKKAIRCPTVLSFKIPLTKGNGSCYRIVDSLSGLSLVGNLECFFIQAQTRVFLSLRGPSWLLTEKVNVSYFAHAQIRDHALLKVL